MKTIQSRTDLQATILLLEKRQEMEGTVLREHFRATYQSMRPVNLLKSAFKDVTESAELKEDLVSAGAGLLAGHLSKRVYDVVQGNDNGSITGTAIQFGVTNLVARNPEVVLAAGRGVFKMFYTAWKGREHNTEEQTVG